MQCLLQTNGKLFYWPRNFLLFSNVYKYDKKIEPCCNLPLRTMYIVYFHPCSNGLFSFRGFKQAYNMHLSFIYLCYIALAAGSIIQQLRYDRWLLRVKCRKLHAVFSCELTSCSCCTGFDAGLRCAAYSMVMSLSALER
jgi:hypothetical protein